MKSIAIVQYLTGEKFKCHDLKISEKLKRYRPQRDAVFPTESGDHERLAWRERFSVRVRNDRSLLMTIPVRFEYGAITGDQLLSSEESRLNLATLSRYNNSATNLRRYCYGLQILNFAARACAINSCFDDFLVMFSDSRLAVDECDSSCA